MPRDKGITVGNAALDVLDCSRHKSDNLTPMHSQRSSARWRFMHAPPRSGAENMARDASLLARAASTGENVFSIYSWEKPTLSFGRNQRALGHYDRAKIVGRDIGVVRRPTGGRAILHHREITYSVTGPVRDGISLRDS